MRIALSAEDREIAHWLADGVAVSLIAHWLDVSPRHAKRRVSAVRRAIREQTGRDLCPLKGLRQTKIGQLSNLMAHSTQLH